MQVQRYSGLEYKKYIKAVLNQVFYEPTWFMCQCSSVCCAVDVFVYTAAVGVVRIVYKIRMYSSFLVKVKNLAVSAKFPSVKPLMQFANI